VALYVLLIVAGIVVTMGVNIANHYLFHSSADSPGWKLKHQIYDSAFLALIVWGVSTVSRITSEWFSNEIMRKEAEQKQIAAELAFLKSQINPHFLFNSLNNIYAICHRSSDPEAAEAIAKLSGLMRYMLFGSATSTVQLKEEIEYLHNYLDLQKMRINKDIEVSFVTKGDIGNFEIAPLLLIPFVENAFKYGLSYVSDSFVRIECTVEKSELKFCVQNTVHERGKSELSSGIGLENVKRRLALLYPGKHNLRINDANAIFDIELTLTA
jgi:two-component system, LytTR family, sensor kinase